MRHFSSALPRADSKRSRFGGGASAGWVPGAQRLLVAREARAGTRWIRSLEVVRPETLATAAHADQPDNLSLFYRWQSPA